MGLFDAGPSSGFWGKMKGAIPGALNSAAQQYGGPMKGPAKSVGGMMNSQGKAQLHNPFATGQLPNGRQFPRGAAMQPAPQVGNQGASQGIVRGPENVPGIFSGGMPGGMGMAMPQPEMGGMGAPADMSDGGLWRMYQNIVGNRGGGEPTSRGMFY